MNRFAAKCVSGALIGVVAGTLTLSAALPAQAGSKDAETIAKIAAGALTIYILNEAIKDKRQKHTRHVTVHQPHHPPVVHHAPKAPVVHHQAPKSAIVHHHTPKKKKPKPAPVIHHNAHKHTPQMHPSRASLSHRQQARRTLPQRCLFTLNTSKGYRKVFGQNCLTNRYAFVDYMPAQCFREHWTPKGWRYGWAPKCLRRNGFAW